MSLFIIGSVSRVTSNIVLQLAKNKQYSRITIADLLPSYEFHHRFYRLQRQLDNLQSQTQLSLQKLTLINDLKQNESFNDVLFVTHDYYSQVTSKTRLMELTALAYKNRKYLYFATPIEYDHFGYRTPEQNYSKSQRKVLQTNPNATFIRSDVQDKGESLAYFNLPEKNFLQRKVFESKFYFSPRVVNANEYARIVCEVMRDRVQGKKLLVRGTEGKQPIYIDYNQNIGKQEYQHAKQNVVSLAQKYNALSFQNYETYTSSTNSEPAK